MTGTLIQPALLTEDTTEKKTFSIFLLTMALHILLVFFLREFRILATLSAISALLFGLYVLYHDATPTRLIYVAGYIVSAEILWRMTNAGVFWEFGKYAAGLLFFLALLRYRMRLSALPIFYMTAQVPGIFMLIGWGFSLDYIRERISFNLSGPLLLTLSVLFFVQYTFKEKELLRLLLVMLVPIGSLSALVMYSTLSARTIAFSDGSNFVTSGGYGPNQVSGMLSLGVLLIYTYFLLEEYLSGNQRLVLFGLGILFFLQSILTYSRGGVFNLLIPLPLATLAFSHKRQSINRFVFFGTIAIVILGYFVLPRLDVWTEGTLRQRFTDLDPTGRDEIIESELGTFLENPIFGVGPGGSIFYTPTYGGIAKVAHTEFTRLLAEHGLLGVAASLFLVLMTIRIFIASNTRLDRFLALAFATWALLDMTHAAMRLSVVSMLFGLSQANYGEDKF